MRQFMAGLPTLADDAPRQAILDRYCVESGVAPVGLLELFTSECDDFRGRLAAWMTVNDVRWPGAVVVAVEVPGVKSELNDGLQICGLCP